MTSRIASCLSLRLVRRRVPPDVAVLSSMDSPILCCHLAMSVAHSKLYPQKRQIQTSVRVCPHNVGGFLEDVLENTVNRMYVRYRRSNPKISHPALPAEGRMRKAPLLHCKTRI